MNAFDAIIGYRKTKECLFERLSALQNPTPFTALGAHLPKGLLLYGRPGVGKTVLAQAFIAESGRKSFAVSHTSGGETFLKELALKVEEARRNAPSILFLDDMDKYTDNDDDKRAFVALQAHIDSLQDSDVFVLATANNLNIFPNSLIREGRFDALLRVPAPSLEDTPDLIAYFLKGVPLEPLNFEDVAALASYSSCAEIKTLINEAALRAAYRGHICLSMDDLVHAFLKEEQTEDEELAEVSELKEETAIHEAGHALLSEACLPGSVGFISILDSKDASGHVRERKHLIRRPHSLLTALAGKAAVEMSYGHLASGADEDIGWAMALLRRGLLFNATGGASFLNCQSEDDPTLTPEQKAAAALEIEHYLTKDKEMVAHNRDFIEAVKNKLLEKGYLLSSELQAIKAAHPIDSSPIAGI